MEKVIDENKQGSSLVLNQNKFLMFYLSFKVSKNFDPRFYRNSLNWLDSTLKLLHEQMMKSINRRILLFYYSYYRTKAWKPNVLSKWKSWRPKELLTILEENL